MIDFQRLHAAQREQYNAILMEVPEQGCEYSFANLCLWGRQQVAFLHGCVAFFSHFFGRTVYPYPIGGGDRRKVLEEILQDARERGIPCRITNMSEGDRQELESWFPGQFRIRTDRDSYDYVYDINDLADLKGRKFQKKRNHVNRFCQEHPAFRVEPLGPENLEVAQDFAAQWYQTRTKEDPQGDYLLESVAMDRAFGKYEKLNFDGLLLLDGEEILAMTMGTPLAADTFDVHFEKARENVEGAYAAVNREFARYLRGKYPELRFLNREDDMGLEGLRKAKLSYNPHHMVEKHWACLAEDYDAD